MQVILYIIFWLYAIGMFMRFSFANNEIINLNLNEPWIGKSLRRYLDKKRNGDNETKPF